jgi:hypothetical protein
MDGWLVAGGHGAYYFGILPAPKIEKLVKQAGFGVIRSWISGQSAYVLCQSDR